VARGVENLVLELRRLRRMDVLVHPEAQPAFEYYRDFLRPQLADRVGPDSAEDPLTPIIDVVGSPNRYLLIRDFAQLQLLDIAKREFAVRVHEKLSRPTIQHCAWQSVMLYEPFSPAPPDIVCAKILQLIKHFPADLVPVCLPLDPKTGEPPRSNWSALSRALGVPLSTLNNVLPHIRNGGVPDVTAEQIFLNQQESPANG